MYVYEMYSVQPAAAPQITRTHVAVVVAVLAAAAGAYVLHRRRRDDGIRVTPLRRVCHANGTACTWAPAWPGARAFVSDDVAPRTVAAARPYIAEIAKREGSAYVTGITAVPGSPDGRAFDVTYAPALGRKAVSVRVASARAATAATQAAPTSAADPAPATLDTGTFANFSMVSY
jgi:hypothetical protein